MAIGFFSIGGLLRRFAPGLRPALAWGVPALALTTLAFWDVWARDGSPDAILLGLAAYELLIWLTERPVANAA